MAGDVVIIGAGISGLYAARCLHEEGLHPIVLEATDHVGGRTVTSRVPGRPYADLGGAYVGKQQTKVIGLAKELGLHFHNVPTKGKSTIKYKGKVTHFTGDIPTSSNVLEILDLVQTLKKIDKLSLEIPLSSPWTAERAKEFDAMSVDDFLKKNCWTNFAQTLLYLGFEAVFAIELASVSFLYALHLTRSSGGCKALLTVKDGLQEMKIVGGSDSISQKMSEQLPAGTVHFNCQVTRIQQDENGVTVTTDDGREFQVPYAIFAASPAVLKGIELTPSLPHQYLCFVNNIQRNHYFKTFMYYDKAYWADAGLKGDVTCDEGIIQIAFCDTKQDGSYPSIMGFIAREKYELMTCDQRKQLIADHYAELFGIEAMRTPSDYIEKHWSNVTEGEVTAPCVYTTPPHFLTTHKRFWGESFGRLHFSSSECSLVMRGYMDGGLRAGEQAAKNILFCLGRTPKRIYNIDNHGVPYCEYTLLEYLLPGVVQFCVGVGVLGVAISVAVILNFF